VIKKVLVPVDGSPLSEAALPVAESIAARFGATVELLRVVPSVLQGVVSFASADVPMLGPDWDDMERDQVSEARRYVVQLGRSLPQRTTVTTSVRLGDPIEEILHRARQGGFDLVVMSTHGRTGVGRWVMGSVAESVARRIGVNVLLVHPAADRAAGDPETSGASAALSTSPTPGERDIR